MSTDDRLMVNPKKERSAEMKAQNYVYASNYERVPQISFHTWRQHSRIAYVG